MACFDKATALAPHDARGFSGRGRSQNLRHRYLDAAADYDAALALDPKDVRSLFERGELLATRDDYDYAKDRARRSFEANKENKDRKFEWKERAVDEIVGDNRRQALADCGVTSDFEDGR